MRSSAIAESASLQHFLCRLILTSRISIKKFQSLKETLSNTGEVISTSPSMDNERPGKLKFKILYAETNDAVQTLSNIPGLIVEEIAKPALPATAHMSFESAFEKLSAELAKLPADPFGDVFEQANSRRTIGSHRYRQGSRFRSARSGSKTR